MSKTKLGESGRPLKHPNYVRPLLNRGVCAGWEFRKGVPSDCRRVVGQRWWVKTWPLDCPEHIVQAEAKALALRCERVITRIRADNIKSHLRDLDKEAEAITAQADALADSVPEGE